VLVIGSRGLGSVASVLLGSVAAQVIREATGPVVVVR
jgi:nucleotide-binding universal stress UspA family protein